MKTITVITFGTFDIFHQGHLNIIQKAKSFLKDENCNIRLIVGVSSNKLNYIKKQKHPIFNETERINIIKSIHGVNDVFIEESLELKEFYCRKYKADILVMGDDHTGRFDYLESKMNIKVHYFPRTPEVSTTDLTLQIERNYTIKICKIFVPTCLSLMNGILGIMMMFQYVPLHIGMMFALWCDALDGYSAKKLNACTKFGAYLDDACDLITWVMMPCLMSYYKYRDNYLLYIYGILAPARLIRFVLPNSSLNNQPSSVNPDTIYFTGLCTPHAAIIWYCFGFKPWIGALFGVLMHVPYRIDIKSSAFIRFLPEIVLSMMLLTGETALHQQMILFGAIMIIIRENAPQVKNYFCMYHSLFVFLKISILLLFFNGEHIKKHVTAEIITYAITDIPYCSSWLYVIHHIGIIIVDPAITGVNLIGIYGAETLSVLYHISKVVKYGKILNFFISQLRLLFTIHCIYMYDYWWKKYNYLSFVIDSLYISYCFYVAYKSITIMFKKKYV